MYQHRNAHVSMHLPTCAYLSCNPTLPCSNAPTPQVMSRHQGSQTSSNATTSQLQRADMAAWRRMRTHLQCMLQPSILTNLLCRPKPASCSPFLPRRNWSLPFASTCASLLLKGCSGRRELASAEGESDAITWSSRGDVSTTPVRERGARVSEASRMRAVGGKTKAVNMEHARGQQAPYGKGA